MPLFLCARQNTGNLRWPCPHSWLESLIIAWSAGRASGYTMISVRIGTEIIAWSAGRASGYTMTSVRIGTEIIAWSAGRASGNTMTSVKIGTEIIAWLAGRASGKYSMTSVRIGIEIQCSSCCSSFPMWSRIWVVTTNSVHMMNIESNAWYEKKNMCIKLTEKKH